jgi:heme A synthase
VTTWCVRRLVLAAFLLLDVRMVEAQQATTLAPQTRNHRTRWWLSAIAALSAASVYTGATRTVEMSAMPPPGGVGRSVGIIVTKQLGINCGFVGVALTAQWFLLKYQGRKHQKLEPLFMTINYAGATALSLDAAVELSGRKPK